MNTQVTIPAPAPAPMCEPCNDKLQRGEPAVCMCVRVPTLTWTVESLNG